VRDLVTILIKDRNVQNGFQIIIAIIADIRICSGRFKKRIALLPNTYGMGFNSRKVFKILYSEFGHV
jgi:hypothetical protein